MAIQLACMHPKLCIRPPRIPSALLRCSSPHKAPPHKKDYLFCLQLLFYPPGIFVGLCQVVFQQRSLRPLLLCLCFEMCALFFSLFLLPCMLIIPLAQRSLHKQHLSSRSHLMLYMSGPSKASLGYLPELRTHSSSVLHPSVKALSLWSSSSTSVTQYGRPMSTVSPEEGGQFHHFTASFDASGFRNCRDSVQVQCICRV